MRIEENWLDGGVFFAILETKETQSALTQNFSRLFTFKDCFTEKEAASLIIKNFPNVLNVIHIDYYGDCHILKKY